MNDYELLYYVYQGDEEALEMLMKRFEKSIYFTAYKILKQLNYQFQASDELKEMTHLGKLEVYRAVYAYRDEGHCSFQVFANQCVEMGMRKYIRHKRSNSSIRYSTALRLDSELKEESGLYYVDALSNHHEEFEGVSILKWYHPKNILECLEKDLLEDEVKIAKYILEGYTQGEISRLLGVKQKRIYYIRHKLKNLLLSYID